MSKLSSRRQAPVLWFLLVLFILRVIGQLLVALGLGGFLPPMEEWQSGLLPYPLLLISQVAIIIFYGKICFDFSSNKGFFAVPHKILGKVFFIFGQIYLASMVLRYILLMSFYPQARWFHGTIPIFLHCVLAIFLIIVGNFHRKYSA